MLMESTIARWHVEGWNVAFREGFVVFDDRLLNAAIIRQLPRCPDRVVLGSSRSMQLRREYFPNERFFNHAMRRAVLEDQVTMWQLYRRRGWRPSGVLLGVDAWLLDGSHWKSYWLPLRDAFSEIICEWQLPYPTGQMRWDATSRSSGSEEFHTSTRLKKSLAGLVSWTGVLMFKTHSEDLKEYVRRNDGSISYHAAFRERSPEEVDGIIRNSVRFPRHSLSPEMTALLEAFVSHLAGDGVEIGFVIPPYHPAFMKLGGRNATGEPIDGYAEYLSALDRVETFIRTLAKKYKSKVFGSFDSLKLGASPYEFFDWMHARPPVFERMFKC